MKSPCSLNLTGRLLSFALMLMLFSVILSGASSAQVARRIVSANGDPILYPSYLKTYDGKLYFRANNLISGNNVELWEFDGTVARLAAEINPGSTGSDPSYLAVYNGKLYFCATVTGNGSKLWSYDSTNGASLAPGSASAAMLPEELIAYGGNLYFRATRYGAPSLNIGTELWKFDGATQTPLDIFAGAGNSYPQHFIEYNGLLYFKACGITNQGSELWRYNGTGMPTEAARIWPNNGSSPENFAIYKQQLYFSADDGVHGRELWRFDGTNASLAADIVPGGQYSSSNPSGLTVYNGKLYFCATDVAHGYELWSFDGTNAIMAAEINFTANPGNGDDFMMDSTPANLTVFDGLLYFSANDGVHGKELWSFDGTTARMVLDINPGEYGSDVCELTVYNGTLYFSANDGSVAGLSGFVPEVFALAAAAPLTLEDALDLPGVVWTTGTHPWLPQTEVTHDGVAAAVSGQVHNADDFSWVKATNVMGPGTVSFWWKAQVSCGAWAQFSMSGSSGICPLGNRLDTTTDWQWVTCILGNGPQELMWRTQGACDDSNQIMLWVDQVVIRGPGNESAPLFTTMPADQTVPAGTNVLFKAVAAGYPLPVLQWRFQGVDMPGETNFTLALGNVQESQAGLYSVVASNAHGRVTNTAQLTVLPSQAVILSQPTNLTVTFGLPARFEVAAQGTWPLAYQWLFNGLPLAGETNSALILNAVTANQGGVYSVCIRNEVGTVVSAQATLAVARLAAWGEKSYGQSQVPSNAVDVVAVSAGSGHSLALKRDGRVLTWGATNGMGYSALPPEDLTNAVKIAAGGWHSLALRDNGTVVAWGFNTGGQTNVPANLNSVVAIAGGLRHSLALKNDGTVVAWGWEPYAQPSVAASLLDVAAITAGTMHNLAVFSNGTVFAWGDNSVKQCDVPPGLSNVIAVAAGSGHSLALKSDGSLAVWGTNDFGQGVIDPRATNVLAIAAGDQHNLALRADGSLVAWGDDRYDQCKVPAGLPALAAVAGGRAHTLALLGPAPAASKPQLLPDYFPATAEFQASVPTVSGRSYFLEANDSLLKSGWVALAVRFGDGTVKVFTDTTGSTGQRFYRVRVQE